jgi:hypothetical protein
MLSAQQLKENIHAYGAGKISLGKFEDWFYENSDDAPAEIDEFVADVDAALSAYRFRHHSQTQLRGSLVELARVSVARNLRPFVVLWVDNARGATAPVRKQALAANSVEQLGDVAPPGRGRNNIAPVEIVERKPSVKATAAVTGPLKAEHAV